MSESEQPSGGGLRIGGLRSPLAGPFTLEVSAGACAAITGASGSGKSLFLRMIADLDPNDGDIALDGAPRRSFTPPQWRGQVVYVPAEAGWWADTVKAHFASDDIGRARRLADQLGLAPELIDGEVARLSTGERQRLAIIRAVLLDPPVLLLDEPTGALDDETTTRVEALIRDLLGKGCAVVMVTHDLGLAGRLATARYRMADRQLGAA